jgi:hypothetical protein
VTDAIVVGGGPPTAVEAGRYDDDPAVADADVVAGGDVTPDEGFSSPGVRSTPAVSTNGAGRVSSPRASATTEARSDATRRWTTAATNVVNSSA